MVLYASFLFLWGLASLFIWSIWHNDGWNVGLWRWKHVGP